MKQKFIRFSEKLDTAAKDAIPITQLGLHTNLSLFDAYAIQKASINLRSKRGEKLVGVKLGFTSKAKMKQMGASDLICGRLTDKMQILNGGALNLNDFIQPRAEPEIAFLIKKDIDTIVGLPKIIDYISGIAAAIEIVDSRYENFKFSLADIIADNCSSSGYVLGDWKDPTVNVSDLKIEMLVNDSLAESGNSNAILGNPLESMVEAVRLANQYEIKLKKGMIVLAGAATPAIYLNSSDKVEVVVEKLGKVSLPVV